jgi:hypothetical protein
MSSEDRRIAPRARVLKHGKIVMMNNWSVVDCCVRDLSVTGARIRCDDPAAVPGEFRLLIPHNNSIQPVRVVWRRADECGVTFTGPARPPPPRRW